MPTMTKEKYVVIGAVVALAIFFLGFIGPWYGISGEFLGAEASIDIGFLGTTFSAGSDSSTFSTEIDRGETDTTMYIALVTIILAIIAFIGILGSIYGFGKKEMMQKIGEIFGIITFLVAIIAIIYYVINLPDTSGLEQIGLNVGLGWGFFLFLIGAIVMFITNIWSRMVRA